MTKFTTKKDKIYYNDEILNGKVLCDILNFFETSHFSEKERIYPSDFLDFNSYVCQKCGKFQIGHDGLWNEEPCEFFCSNKCYKKWHKKRKK